MGEKPMRERDIHKIIDAFTRQQTIPGYSRLVPFAEIMLPGRCQPIAWRTIWVSRCGRSKTSKILTQRTSRF